MENVGKYKMKGPIRSIGLMCVVIQIFHLYTTHLKLLVLYFWIMLGYDYLGNLWYGIIALNDTFTYKFVFLS